MAKYALLRNWVAAELPGVRCLEAPAGSDSELALAHSPSYIEAIASGQVSAAAMREIGFPWSPEMVERSRRSTGATIEACRAALRDGVAGNLAGGTHHASQTTGSGFCVFNDAAVAARLVQAEAAGTQSTPLRIAVIDLDVHQGNGTASIFTNDSSVFTLSMHGEKNFPIRKTASDLDVDLPDGCTDEPYLAALDGALQAMSRRFEPQLIIYLAGADPHEGDRLGRLKLSFDGLRARDTRVFAWARERRIALAFAMAGGYGRDIQTTVQVQQATVEEAKRSWDAWQADHTAAPAAR